MRYRQTDRQGTDRPQRVRERQTDRDRDREKENRGSTRKTQRQIELANTE